MALGEIGVEKEKILTVFNKFDLANTSSLSRSLEYRKEKNRIPKARENDEILPSKN